MVRAVEKEADHSACRQRGQRVKQREEAEAVFVINDKYRRNQQIYQPCDREGVKADDVPPYIAEYIAECKKTVFPLSDLCSS